MAKYSLIPYSRKSHFFEFSAEINVLAENIFVSYLISGSIDDFDFDQTEPNKMRLVKLWEKTCFELFIKNERNEYLEFNFSPRFEWNCFYFLKKGDHLKEWNKMPMPDIDILRSLEKFFLVANIKKEFFPENFLTKNMSAGISSVLKDNSNNLEYWAISHEDTRPNFHHFDSFKYKF